MALGLIHLPLIGYFGAIGGLLSLVSPQLFRRKQTTGSLVFLLLSALSLLATWTYMGLYFQHSFREAALERGIPPSLFSTKQWLEDVSLFNEAWGYVCQTPERYWWSEQLMYWTTGPLAMLMSIEGEFFDFRKPFWFKANEVPMHRLLSGQRRNVQYLWVYMLIGQIVAISFAQSLFFAALALSPAVLPRAPVANKPLGPPPGQTWTLVASVMLGAVGTTLVPARVSTEQFLPLLLGIHLFAVLPLVDYIPQKLIRLPPSRLYFNYAFISLRLRWDTISQVIDVSKFTSNYK